MSEPRILVLGAGPAGTAVALGLSRLGYRVRVVSEWRRFEAVEGVSQRALDGLHHAGLISALASAAAPSPRRVVWSGEDRVINQEYLIDRPRFDAALRQDLRTSGVEPIEARVRQVESNEHGHRVSLESGVTLEADFLVEARGRQAPLAGGRRRGPETLSLLLRWHQPAGPNTSAVESLIDGWSWMARMGDGRCYWQITLDAANAELPAKEYLANYCAWRRGRSALARELFGNGISETGVLHARSSTAILFHEASGSNWLRVGDAAMAVDPLSGNGIFQSLSSALQAPAVINTLLRQPGRGRLARQFHQQRIDHLFLRFARTGRDFYALEQRWPEQPFWQARSGWPDVEPLHAVTDFSQVHVARAPVIREDTIVEAEVVITTDQPLGIWHLHGLELAPLVRALQAGARVEQVLGGLAAWEQNMLSHWLVAQGYRPG